MAQVPSDTDNTGSPSPTTSADLDTGADDADLVAADDDEGPLSVSLDEASELVEVYHTDNDLAAGLVIDEILGPAGIRALAHDRRSHAIPAPAAMPGQIGIAVPVGVAGRARRILREARADGVLQDEGQIIDAGEDEQMA